MFSKSLKALLIIGGKGTRLQPLTNHINKHEINIGGSTMIEHALDTIIATGITQIAVKSNTNYSNPKLIDSILARYKTENNNLTFRHRCSNSSGIADEVKQMKDILADSYFALVFGDVLYESKQNIANYVNKFENTDYEGMLLLAKAEHPERHATPIIKDGKLVEIVEKHKSPPTDFVVTTWDIYPPQALNYVSDLKLSGRGELEISDLRTRVLEKHLVGSENYKGWWIDAGIPKDLIRANELVLKNQGSLNFVDSNAIVRDSEISLTTISGEVVVENSRIKNSIIQGYIKLKNVDLENCVIMGNAVIANTVLKNHIQYNNEFNKYEV